MIITCHQPVHLAKLGWPRQGDGHAADLATVWLTPYPVIIPYLEFCRRADLNPFGGGSREQQGPRDVPGYITSGYRDKTIAGNSNSPHMYGLALDIVIGSNDELLRVAGIARELYPRVGIYIDRGFMHVDAAPDNWLERHRLKRYWAQIAGSYRTFSDFDRMMNLAARAA